MSEIHGVVPPIVTPFDAQEEIDLGLLRAEVRHLIDNVGVHGIAAGGSTGEGHTLTTEELRQVVAATVETADGRVPVIAGIIVDSTREAIAKGRALADLDVAALQITPVHYLFKPTDEMMYRHFATIADALGRPVIIYNVVPWSYCSAELLARIITQVYGVIGMQQSAGDLKRLADLMLALGGRGLVMSAVDALLYPSFCLGAHGTIAAIVTAVPELSVRLWDAVQAGDHETALDMHVKMLRVWNAIAQDNLPANVKTALELQGRPAGLPRSPMPPSSPEQRQAIRKALAMAGLIDVQSVELPAQ